MTCPKCNTDNTRVYGDRETERGNRRRYRKCLTCGHRFKTIEYYVPDVYARRPRRISTNDLGDYPEVIENQFDNLTGSMNL